MAIRLAAREYASGSDRPPLIWSALNSHLTALCRDEPLDGDFLRLFQALERWEQSVSPERERAEDDIRSIASSLGKMPTHPDYYASAQSIAAQLFERGEFDWSREIEEAIEGGSTATEILMRVRFALQRLLRSGLPTEAEEMAAQSLVAQLDEVLR